MAWEGVFSLSTKSKKYSLVIPCFNEEAGLRDLVKACQDAQFSEAYEIILVDNGSTDSTLSVLEELLRGQSLMRIVHTETNKGYGAGVLFGLKHAKGDILGWTHADLQTDPADFMRAVEIFESRGRNVFVKGKRFGRSSIDVFFTICMSIFETILLQRFFWDINSQPNVFSRDFYETWVDPPSDFSLDLFVYYLAKKCGLPVERFPVYFGDRKHGESHWNINWRSKVKFIRRTMAFSFEIKRRND